MEVTVADALKIGALKECKLIGGKMGVDRKISWVDTMEIPNISPWLKKNELLITTGYAIKNDAGALIGLLRDMAQVQAAGLAIKTRFLGGFSQEIIELANELALPLIEIPPEIPFVDITHPLMKALVDEHNSKLEFSERMNAKFMELELNAGGFESIAQMLSNLISLPVIITSPYFEVLARSDAPGWNAPDDLIVQGEFSPRLSDEIVSQVHGCDISRQLTGPGGIQMLIRSAVVKRQVCGYIFVLFTGQGPDDMQLIALNHAATSVALEFSKLQMLEDNTRIMDSNLFIDLMTGNIKLTDEADYRAQMLRWPGAPLRIAVADIDDFERDIAQMEEEDIQKLKEDISGSIKKRLLSRGIGCTVIVKSDSFTCLMSDVYDKAQLIAAFSDIVTRMQQIYGIKATVGISETCREYIQIPASYEEARDAIAIGRMPNIRRSVVDIGDVRLEQALYKSAGSPYFRRFVGETIGQLEEYDKANGTRLINTLDVLVKNMGARNKTAEDLFLHRNTLSNKIKKIEKITGYHLSKSEDLFHLGLALKIRYFVR
ncbi:PucR family transcriptional regulator [Zongyangia hominis]|uniref:PucR family transcriptional regulator ligand-binding domain-containing protein n=1 Tax=Zongyangia hominis TaxID=2763677 RepID=A0A926ICG8_9FIRM|nr:PucR family transcriptional regulator [Zongyangia hominis]MBC8571110.1 PucR family transcriptional regulator ligand-binding domain-containing protein [Zongyangia hominis]